MGLLGKNSLCTWSRSWTAFPSPSLVSLIRGGWVPLISSDQLPYLWTPKLPFLTTDESGFFCGIRIGELFPLNSHLETGEESPGSLVFAFALWERAPRVKSLINAFNSFENHSAWALTPEQMSKLHYSENGSGVCGPIPSTEVMLFVNRFMPLVSWLETVSKEQSGEVSFLGESITFAPEIIPLLQIIRQI